MPTLSVPVLEDLPPLASKRVLLRADFNVPVQDGRITDDLRIRAALPTITWLQDQGATVVACTHWGRPLRPPAPEYSGGPLGDGWGVWPPGLWVLYIRVIDRG